MSAIVQRFCDKNVQKALEYSERMDKQDKISLLSFAVGKKFPINYVNRNAIEDSKVANNNKIEYFYNIFLDGEDTIIGIVYANNAVRDFGLIVGNFEDTGYSIIAAEHGKHLYVKKRRPGSPNDYHEHNHFLIFQPVEVRKRFDVEIDEGLGVLGSYIGDLNEAAEAFEILESLLIRKPEILK